MSMSLAVIKTPINTTDECYSCSFRTAKTDIGINSKQKMNSSVGHNRQQPTHDFMIRQIFTHALADIIKQINTPRLGSI